MTMYIISKQEIYYEVSSINNLDYLN